MKKKRGDSLLFFWLPIIILCSSVKATAATSLRTRPRSQTFPKERLFRGEKKLLAENEQLKAENEQLKNENEHCVQEILGLEQQITVLKKEKSETNEHSKVTT